MAERASATVQMDEKGRVTIPKGTRKALGIDGSSAHLDLDVMLIEEYDE